jgi:hypothetical protein
MQRENEANCSSDYNGTAIGIELQNMIGNAI